MEIYNDSYFAEGIFSTDYQLLASTIATIYRPKTIVEFGCGPGHLSKEFAKMGIKVTAIDGYSAPDFQVNPLITFKKVDLNSETEVSEFIQNSNYDLAVCTEVAEHLKPSSSNHLIKYLTKSAPVVVFSAAVPHQGGAGHINCQPRGFWNKLFDSYGFKPVDSIRPKLQNKNIAIWYQLNVIDYVSSEIETDAKQTINNLIDAESHAASLYYQKANINSKTKHT